MRRMHIGLALVALLAVPAGAQTGSIDQGATKLRPQIARHLKDPESARFEGLRRLVRPNVRGEPTEVVCGQVNAKNEFGGYVGARPFVYLVALDQLLTVDDSDPIVAQAVHQRFCR